MPTMVGKVLPSECFMALSYVVKLGPIVSGGRSYLQNDDYNGTDIEELLAIGRISAVDAPTVKAEDSSVESQEAPSVTDLSGLNSAEAKQAIESCDDVELLQSWIAIESRSTIRKAINDRLADLKEAE
jgi:hypothetical protein